MRPRHTLLAGSLALILALAAARAQALPTAPASAPVASPAHGEEGRAGDRIEDLLARMTAFFHRGEVNGVTPDPRSAINPSEAARLGVVSQLLGFNALARVRPSAVLRQDVVDRANFLVDHFDELTSGTAFDGMTGYALLGAYEIAPDPRYLEKGRLIADRSCALSGWTNTLNWGLMSALALAKDYQLTGNLAARDKTLEILASLRPYQNRDGSFPHYCPGSVDVHYTAWMSMELLIVRRWVPSPMIDQYLAGTRRFLSECVDSVGLTTYQVPCPSCPGGWFYRFGRRSGCVIDYDTRGWVNELGYSALLYGEMRDPLFSRVMDALRNQESGGAFADKWDYLPEPYDPIYPWATASPSVIRTSVIFWSLAELEADRRGAWVAARDDDDDHEGGGSDDDGRDHDADMVARQPDGASRLAPGGVAGAGGSRWDSPGVADVDSLMLAVIQGRELGAPTPRESSAPGGAGGEGGDAPRQGGRRSASATGDGTDNGPTLPTAAAAGPGSAPLTSNASVTRLERVTPNPVREGCTVVFSLAGGEDVRLEILDLAGRRVRSLASGTFAVGAHRAAWDGLDDTGRRAPAGLYFAALSNPRGRQVVRFAVTR